MVEINVRNILYFGGCRAPKRHELSCVGGERAGLSFVCFFLFTIYFDCDCDRKYVAVLAWVFGSKFLKAWSCAALPKSMTPLAALAAFSLTTVL